MGETTTTDPPEHWTIAQVTEFLGAASPGSARRTLSRWGVRAAAYVAGVRGRPEARYDAQQVRDAHASRPGRGARTDLESS